MLRNAIIPLAFVFALRTAYAQTENPAQTEDSLEELMHLKASKEASELQKMLNDKVGVSSKKELSLRETPGIVSIVTAEEITNMGARDLIDVLRIVPGLDFGSDLDFVVGLGVRGNWASEGKVLLLVDGIEMNETLFQTLQFGNHFPVDQIEKIEVIRGPGSAIYGGTAEYGVINIITKGASGFQGVAVTGIYGQLENTYGRRNVGLTAGKRFNYLKVDASVFKGEGNRNDQMFQELYRDSVDLSKGFARMDPLNVNVGLQYKNASIRTLYDHYRTTTPFHRIDYTSFSTVFKYDIKVNDKIQLTSQLSYTRQLPWEYVESFREDVLYEYKVSAERYKANVTASYDVSRKLNFVLGSEYFHDQASDKLEYENFGEGRNEVAYYNVSMFAQGLYKHRLANVTAGFRYDNHSTFGSAFVPRLAVTKRIENFHFKTLYSQSFRAPGIENISNNSDIKPEKSHVAELELGYQFTPQMLLSANLYHIRTKDVIVYAYEGATKDESYMNYSLAGSHGLELVYAIRKKQWYANVNYSFYSGAAKSTVDTYRVEGHDHLNVAFPAHKLTLNSDFQLSKGLHISPSIWYQSARYAYNALDENQEPVLNRLSADAKANLFVHYENAFAKGVSLGVGTYDIFDKGTSYIQAYKGDYAPVPGPGREFIIKLRYDFMFNK